MDSMTVLPARTGVAFRLRRGERLQIVNTHGTQVVDCWALNPADLREHMSMPHSRNHWYRLVPRPGDLLVTNLRNPILRLVEDTSPGVHDTLIPCCDPVRYAQLGIKGRHASCAENFSQALRALAIEAPPPPAPLNLFMNVPIKANGALAVAPPDSKPGDYVVLEAQTDCLVVLSACPHDIFPVNGADCTPKDVAYRVLPGA
ncbi:MAG TPA: urea carboxylase-associated family protein [Methylomirabilota bacterium]|nr:urea carboxylase-associated family protein [Methylomirabilota bacterium]